jgi:hypothetical protein
MNDTDFLARNIVNQLADLWRVPFELRQATNDRADRFVAGLLNKLMTDRELHAVCHQQRDVARAALRTLVDLKRWSP